MELWLIVWLLCGIASGMIAHSRQRSFGGFFALGLILGVFGLLLTLLGTRGPATQPTQPPPP